MTLEEQKEIMKKDLTMKYQRGDWHGVADAAMDLREIEVEIRLAKEYQATYIIQGSSKPGGL